MMYALLAFAIVAPSGEMGGGHTVTIPSESGPRTSPPLHNEMD